MLRRAAAVGPATLAMPLLDLAMALEAALDAAMVPSMRSCTVRRRLRGAGGSTGAPGAVGGKGVHKRL